MSWKKRKHDFSVWHLENWLVVVAWLNNRPFWLKAPPPIGVKVSIRFPTHPFPAKGYGGGNSRALERLSCGRWHMPTSHWQQLIRRFHHHPKRSDVRGWVVAQSLCPFVKVGQVQNAGRTRTSEVAPAPIILRRERVMLCKRQCFSSAQRHIWDGNIWSVFINHQHRKCVSNFEDRILHPAKQYVQESDLITGPDMRFLWAFECSVSRIPQKCSLKPHPVKTWQKSKIWMKEKSSILGPESGLWIFHFGVWICKSWQGFAVYIICFSL